MSVVNWMQWCQKVEDLVGETAFLDTETNLTVHELHDKFVAGFEPQEVADKFYNKGGE